MYIKGMLALFLMFFACFDWYARRVFIACAYQRKFAHGKTPKRARGHYKLHWTLPQRLFWVPVFEEYYERKYRWFAYSSYLQFGAGLVTSALFLVNELAYTDFTFWQYAFYVYAAITLARFIYVHFVSFGKIWH